MRANSQVRRVTLPAPHSQQLGLLPESRFLPVEEKLLQLPAILRFFAHRVNQDGTAESIGLFCFATIGSASHERELEIRESAHAWLQGLDATEKVRPFFAGRQQSRQLQ
jgi:hypothetical protein